MEKITKEMIIAELKNVLDPELHINIVDLGLVYDVLISPKNDIQVNMTLTTPACPLGPQVEKEIREALEVIEAIGEVKVEFVWEPAWTPERMSDDAKDQLGIDD